MSFNATTVFDPFSRHIPLRVEARLDDAIMDYIYRGIASGTSAAPQSTLAVASRVRRDIETQEHLTVPISTSYLEPTLVWSAAKLHLPFVEVNGSRIIEPAIAEPPVEDGPEKDAVVHVIGADPLFTPVDESKEIKAVRVVELKIPPTPQVETPISSQPRVKRSLLDPILADPIPSAEIPDGGFVVVGNIQLFGSPDLTARFEKWEGPAPSNVVVLPDQPVAVERATLPEEFHLSAVIPALEGTAFDDITFSNVSIYHQNYQFDTTKAIGWHFNADLVIDKACGALHDVLVQALGVDEPVLGVYVFLGTDGGWGKPLSLHSFTLEGIFAGIAVKPIDGVVLSKIGVRIFGIRTLKYDPLPRSALEYGFSVFGTMHLDVPGSTVPLNLEYAIQEFGGAVCLGASVDTWKNPLGAKGLVVRMTE